MLPESKSVLRKRFLNLLRDQKQDQRFKKDRIILEKLLATKEFKEAGAILLYASFDGEVDTFEMIKQSIRFGKKTALPAIIKDQKKLIPTQIRNVENDLKDGPYGIKHPAVDPDRQLPLDKLDLVIVPGLAFDSQNNRLGRGEGYYDRFLKSLPQSTPVFGLAYDFQMIDRLPPPEEHDIRVSRVIFN